jgi:hypothetical protein
MCVAGHQNFGCKELEECGIKWGRMAGNSEEGQGPQRAVVPMMMMNILKLWRVSKIPSGGHQGASGHTASFPCLEYPASFLSSTEQLDWVFG